MNHPSATDLALFAGSDLHLLDRWRVSNHLRSCEQCREGVATFRAATEDLKEETGGLPAGLNWDRLAAEMTGNIHVGLEAAECVGSVAHPVWRISWRAAAVLAGLSVVLLSAWFLNPVPRPTRPELRAAPRVEMRNTATGLELNENGNALVLLHGRGVQAQRPLIVSSPGTLRARFVDADTGQITINNVYVE